MPNLFLNVPVKLFFACQVPNLVAAQLPGGNLNAQQASALRNDISTDEITPVAILSH